MKEQGEHLSMQLMGRCVLQQDHVSATKTGRIELIYAATGDKQSKDLHHVARQPTRQVGFH